MTTAVRVVRPFIGLEPFETWISQISLRVASETVPSGGRIILSSDTFASARVVLELAVDDRTLTRDRNALLAHANELELAADDLELVVSVSSPYLRRVDVVERVALEEVPRTMLLSRPPRPFGLQTPRSGAVVEIDLCLRRDIERRALRPWRRGTWLARTKFRIESEQSNEVFRVAPLDDVQRTRLQLPKGTARFVEITAASVVAPGSDESAVTVWLDESLLAGLSARPDSPAAQMVQIETFLQVVADVVRHGHERGELRDLSADDIENSLLGRVLFTLADVRLGESAAERRAAVNEMLDLAADSPSTIVALAQARLGYAKLAQRLVQA